jgi:UDP-glucose 4-epimerase
MTAIVTGGAGFIGSHLVDRLGDAIVVDPLGVLPYRIQDFPLALISGADVIYHLASPVGPVGVLDWAGRLVLEVIETTKIVRRWAFVAGCPLVYVSTSEIYGPQPAGRTPEDANRIIPAGHSARMEYAVAKLAAETMLLNTPGLDVRIVRPFNVAGPRQKPDGGFVLPRFIKQALAGEPLTVYAPGTQRRAFTHVLDIVDGIVRAAEHGKPGSIYNLGNPDNECTIAGLAAEVILETHSTSEIEVIDPVTLWGVGFKEAPDKIPDIARAVQELGWQPTRDRRTIIRDAAA